MNNPKNKVEEYIQQAAEEAALQFMESLDTVRRRCESPIEELMMCALYACSKISEHDVHFMLSEKLPVEPYFPGAAFVFQQIEFGNYRTDIAIMDATEPFEKARVMIVECDGHDFHERTKEQARRDKKRDRFFQSMGIKVLRFTGSEIWADPDQCAEEVLGELAINDDWRQRKP